MCWFVLKSILSLADMSCRSRLATLNEKLTALERRIEYIEARVSILLSNEFCCCIYFWILKKWSNKWLEMRLFTGDKRRDPNLDIMMKAPNTLQPPAHPPILSCWSVMDSTLLLGTMWTIFILYVSILCFMPWHICIENMVWPWVAVT